MGILRGDREGGLRHGWSPGRCALAPCPTGRAEAGRARGAPRRRGWLGTNTHILRRDSAARNRGRVRLVPAILERGLGGKRSKVGQKASQLSERKRGLE